MNEFSEVNAIDKLQFRRSIARFYLKQSSERNSARPLSSNVTDLYLNGADHIPEKLT